MTHHLFICRCGSPQHQLVLSSDPDMLPGEVCVSIHLAPLSLWRRLGVAWCYLRGRRSRYGCWEEILLDAPAVLALADTLFEAVNGDPFFAPNDVH